MTADSLPASASECVRRLADRALTSTALVEGLLARIARDEPRLHAWAWLSPEHALAQARAADARPCPPLYGLPVGVKDIIDTADAPTECGTPLLAGRRPAQDALAVARLRAAGAVVPGKTVTTELAYFGPGPTRNPWNPRHTPGGSSSGSAAAVASGMVPAALGTQTAGSLVRPGAYCGVFALRPTHGLLPLDGVHPLAPTFDTLGVLVPALEDVALLLSALGASIAAPSSAAPPRVGLWRTPAWGEAAPAMRARLERVAAAAAAAGARVDEVSLGAGEAGLLEAQATVMAVEAAASLGSLVDRGGDAVSAPLQSLVARGRAASSRTVAEARGALGAARVVSRALFERVDVLLTPGADGEAPEGLGATGDPRFHRVPTALGGPCLAFPAGLGPAALPLGLQLVGAPGADGALLAHAAWLLRAAGLPDVAPRPPGVAP